MVDLREISEVLKKLKSNRERLIYLKGILEEIKDKDLKQNVKDLIDDIKELDAVAQIETRGRVDWSLPEEEAPKEERRLESQVISIPIKEEKEEEKKIEYSLSSGVDLYRGRERETGGITYKRMEIGNLDEGKSFIEGSSSIMEGRINKQYLGGDLEESSEEIMRSDRGEIERYHTSEQVDYASSSVSQEVHEREKKKHRH